MEPQESRRTEKVLVYLTRGRSLLLFRHVHHPEAGVHDLDATPPELIAGHGLFLLQLRQLAS